jgi:hypothetical protein
MLDDRDDVSGPDGDVSSGIPDPETSSAYQDGSSSDATLFTGPTDEGSTNLGPGLTDGGTGTEINTEGDISKGGMGGSYGYGGATVGGTGSGGIGTTGEGIPPKPEGDYEV